MDRPDHELPNDYLGIYSDFDDGEGEEGIEEGGFYDAWYSFVPPFCFLEFEVGGVPLYAAAYTIVDCRLLNIPYD